MGISRRLRFEILRRDDHTCRYCGAKPPQVELTVDHVIPTTLGGTDDPTNLVTACRPCNSGKSSISPDSPIVADVDQDAIRWARAIERAAYYRSIDRQVVDDLLADFDRYWVEDWSDAVDRPPDWPDSIERFLANLTLADLKHFVDVAMRNTKVAHRHVWTYFCGCCWRAIEDLQADAQRIIQAEETPNGPQ